MFFNIGLMYYILHSITHESVHNRIYYRNMRTNAFCSYGSVDLILHDVHKATMSLTLKGLYDIARQSDIRAPIPMELDLVYIK